jgi:hypothetical protein
VYSVSSGNTSGIVAWKAGVKAADADCKKKNEEVDLPNLVHEGLNQHDRGPDQLECDQQRAPGNRSAITLAIGTPT